MGPWGFCWNLASRLPLPCMCFYETPSHQTYTRELNVTWGKDSNVTFRHDLPSELASGTQGPLKASHPAWRFVWGHTHLPLPSGSVPYQLCNAGPPLLHLQNRSNNLPYKVIVRIK